MTDQVDRLVGLWLSLSDVAHQLGASPNRVRQLIREHQLAAIRRPGRSEPSVPAEFLIDGEVIKGLGGTLTLLFDHGFSEVEAVEWLFTADDSLPGRPVDALREDRGKEVRRRAQALV